MGLENINRIIFFYLLIMMFTIGNHAAREMIKENNKELKLVHNSNEKQNFMNDPTNVLRLHSMDTKATDMHTHHATSSMHMMGHMDPSLMVFFFIQDLQIGNKLQIYFPKREPLSPSHFLSKQKADSIPFSSKQLPNLLKLFSFSQDSPQAKAMNATLRECENMAIEGETKLCITSYESMVEFARGILGSDAQLRVLSTTHLPEQHQTPNLNSKNLGSATAHLTKSSNKNTLLQTYTILEVPKQILAPKMVACHTMPYPYAIFYCHYQTSESKVLKMLLEGENGERVEGLALCHLDTSHWGSGHVSFKVLGIEPGSSPVCHFLPADNLVWVEKFPTLV